MASSEDWAPLPQRKSNKKNRESQSKIFSQLMEMFGSTFESDIVKSVAETCSWKLEQAIETLITLASESHPTSDDYCPPEAEESKLAAQPSNKAFLESQKAMYDPWAADDFPDVAIETDWALPLEAQDPMKDSAKASPKEATKETPKVETASLCGLKVEYRPRGMDANSDDDADVVIEESSGASSRAVSPETVNVCQFLAAPTQCPPRITFPRTICASTPSPPLTPQRKAKQSDLARIEAEIREGFRVLILMRGAPGSGKSYLARSILSRTLPEARVLDHVFSTDDYFVRINRGVYVFDHTRLSEAHEFNQHRVLMAMRDGFSPIFVDNTNTQVWEMQQYASMGVQYGYIIETVEPETPWARNVNELEKRNAHHVPKAKIRLMLERYEHNISGEKLVRMLKLKYSIDNQPPKLRKQPPLTAMRTSSPMTILTSPERRPRKPRKVETPQKLIDNDALNTIANEYANLEDNVKNPHDSWTEGISYKEDSLLDLMKLGAIGSERKTVSPKDSENAKDIKQEKKEHQDETDSKSQENEQIQLEEPSLLLDADDVSTDKVKVKVEPLNVEDLISCENNNNVTSDIMEPIKVEATTNNKDKKDIKIIENVTADKDDLKLIEAAIKNEEHNASKPVNEKSREISESEKESSSSSDKSSCHSSFEHSSDIDMSQYEMCNTSEADSDLSIPKKTGSTNFDKQSSSGLSSLFNFINSFLVNDKENTQTSPESQSNSSSVEMSTPAEKVQPQEVVNSLDNSATDEFFEARETDAVELVKEQLLDASSDFQLVEHRENEEHKVSKEESKISNIISDEAILEDIYKKFEFDLRKVSEEISKENILDDKNVFDEKNVGSLSCPAGVDNVNLISWRESPFPIDEATSKKLQTSETDSVKVETIEQETNTHPYDFNAAYVGGTDEYKVLNAFNRNINNDRSSPTDDKILPQGKLMLHKGTMTTATSVLSDHALFEMELDAELEDRGDELVELFSQLPRDYVLDVYHNWCKGNLNWAVDYLTNLQYDDPSICAVIDQLDAPSINQDQGSLSKESIDLLTRTSSESSSSSAETAQQKPDKEQLSQQPRASRRKKLPSPYELALQRQLQEKFVLSEESYNPHTLRVKRWKKRDFSPPQQQIQPQPTNDEINDVIRSNTLSMQFIEFVPAEASKETKHLTRLDHPAVEEQPAEEEEEESYEDEVEEEEEMMELKLGYEFISVLESEFGNSGFQVPDGLFPVIQIRRSMAQELHALWIESMQRQLWVMQEQLDAVIAKDAEYARSLEAEEARALPDKEMPSLREVFDMEMALAKCNNNKHKMKWERSLREMFPEYDLETLREIYEAHNRNFEETVNVLRDNSPEKPTMADVLKKRNDLFSKLKDQNTTNENQKQFGAYGQDYDDDDDYMSYEDAMKYAHDSREEASRQYNLRNENYKKAAEACRLKRPQVASYYSDVAKIHVKQMESANAKAAAAILAAQAYVHQSDDKLDLHKLRVVEAMQVLDIFIDDRLNEMSKGERKTVYIITGRGMHSPAGYSRIKPKVAERLHIKNIIFEEINPGMLKVILRKK